MKRTMLFVGSMTIGLACLAADRAPARDDALGSGLAALWRDSRPEASAAQETFVAGGLALLTPGRSLVRSAAALPNDALGAAPAYGSALGEVPLRGGLGLSGQLGMARVAVAGGDPNRPSWASTGATFGIGAWRAFVSHERAQDWFGPGATDEGWRLGAAYRFRSAQISAGWERLQHDMDLGDARQQGWWIGLAQRIGDGALRLNYARAGDVAGSRAPGLGGARQLSLGYEYGLSPQTAIYAFYTRLSNDPNGLFRLGGGEVENALPATSRTGLSLGVRHSF